MTDEVVPPADELRRPGFPRATVILLGIAGGVAAAFGLAAISSIAGPVLFAMVLTITVQPVRVALEKRGVPRGIAPGPVIVSVFALLAGFFAGLFLALGQSPSLLPQCKPQLQAFAADVAEILARVGFG